MDRPATTGMETVVGERLLWLGPHLGPVTTDIHLERARVVFAGDSRAKFALHLSLAPWLGLGKLSMVWGSAVKTADLLLPFVEDPKPRSMVVCLSALGLVGKPNPPIREALRVFHPACNPASTPAEVRAWANSERLHLQALGFDEAYATGTLRWWTQMHQGWRKAYLENQHWLDTQEFDRWLGQVVDRKRSLWFHPIEPGGWQLGFWRTDYPEWNARVYQVALAPHQVPALKIAARELTERIAVLSDKGWRVACVRLPADPSLWAIEESAGSTSLLAGIAAELGVPYLDLGPWPNSTTDGSHAHWETADRVTHQVADWLHSIWD